MKRTAAYESGPFLVAATGIVLFLASAGHHLAEIETVGTVTAPLLAFALDGLPALGLVAGGRRLSRAFEPENSWRVLCATIAGSAVVTGVVALSILFRLGEGRPISEPTFQFLVGATAGAVAGFASGYIYAHSRERARRATRAMSTLSFTNGVLRHDIKNDMAVIRGRARVIADADPDDELIDESARTIDSQVEEVLELVDSTSAIAETLSDDPDYGEVDLTTFVEDVLTHTDGAYEAMVTAELPDSAPIHANQAVRTVVSNLVENAIEHNDADEPAVHVTVEPLVEDVRLRVVDNGPGVPEPERPTLFEPRPSDTGRGGLHVVATLVENFGGEIRIEDNEPRGTTFVVDLPRTPESDGDSPAIA
ncbi:MAG: ATP-binding protein [Halapricum sp.]